jgi:putative membrane protein
MRAVVATVVLSGLIVALPASAQTPSAQSAAEPPPAQAAPAHMPSAIKLENPELGAKEPPGLMPGANSFAEGQAKALIESKGYDNVSALVNDSRGIWHGTATKGQAKVHVSVDYKGHVDAK